MVKDYSNGKIYIIKSNFTNKVYIGSTIYDLKKRFDCHRNLLNCTSREIILNYSDSHIELLKNFPCSCKKELEREEGRLQLLNSNCVNKYIAGRTRKEYKEFDKEKWVKYCKNYKEVNRDKLALKRKETIICVFCKKTIRKRDRKRHQSSNLCKKLRVCF
tara:strand:- start:47 stop:526 length:480 start_codon:yes stop_codon:yes gene_type:complete